ncbi:MAG: 3'-5' exonuclease [Wenzhouxiangella sp.]|nr:3'-5' exonuclease [Wenzhouxiangella sp.]
MSADQAARPSWPARLQALSAAGKDPALAKFHAAMAEIDPAMPLAEVPMVALDLETTGFDPHADAVVSIGLVPMDLRRIRLAGSRYWVVRPRREVEDASILIHHITHEEIDPAPDLVDILPELLEAMAGRVVVVHYRQIERSFLDAVVQRRLGETMAFPLIDTMALEAWMLRSNRHWGQRLADRLKLRRRPGLRLGQVRERYGLPAYTPHHALTDALATAELFHAQVAWHFDADTPIGNLWL